MTETLGHRRPQLPPPILAPTVQEESGLQPTSPRGPRISEPGANHSASCLRHCPSALAHHRPCKLLPPGSGRVGEAAARWLRLWPPPCPRCPQRVCHPALPSPGMARAGPRSLSARLFCPASARELLQAPRREAGRWHAARARVSPSLGLAARAAALGPRCVLERKSEETKPVRRRGPKDTAEACGATVWRCCGGAGGLQRTAAPALGCAVGLHGAQLRVGMLSVAAKPEAAAKSPGISVG